MHRRTLIGTLVGCVLALPLVVNAQPGGKTYRIGYLHPASSQDPGGAFSALKQALAGLGYLVGRNVKFEERFADGKLERLPSLAAELVTLRVDVLVAVSPSAIRAARDATATIPIVMAFSGDDPVKSGFVASLARPGGNITGMTSLTSELAPKWIELLQDAMPGIKRIAVLRSPVRPDHTEQVEVMQDAARPRGVRLQVVEAQNLEQYRPAFEDMKRQRARRSSFSRDRSSRRICRNSRNWQRWTGFPPCGSTGTSSLPEGSFRTVPTSLTCPLVPPFSSTRFSREPIQGICPCNSLHDSSWRST
jgi:putative ABC transport system substrate-binding protein